MTQENEQDKLVRLLKRTNFNDLTFHTAMGMKTSQAVVEYLESQYWTAQEFIDIIEDDALRMQPIHLHVYLRLRGK